ncbi:MAG: hypothetical protein RJB60_99 [Pseudomonadota bacterium]|jgi:hypothetical protein
MNQEQANPGGMQTAIELSEVKGQLRVITQMLQTNHDATNQRIDDLRHSVEGRLDSHQSRIETLEHNERSTAIKAGISGALSGSLAGALVEGLKALVKAG